MKFLIFLACVIDCVMSTCTINDNTMVCRGQVTPSELRKENSTVTILIFRNVEGTFNSKINWTRFSQI